jgi:sterol desaturase/sphingolipid hydroxylase (fatty acid hydroxylase superfamily)
MINRYFIEFFTGSGALLWLVIFLVGRLVERVRPAEPVQPSRNVIFNIGYAIVLSWVIFTVMPAVVGASVIAINTLGGGLIVLPKEGWGLLWAVLLYLLAMDFLEYVFHRAQHAWPFLWAMHSLHHGDPSVNVTTTPRHFWVEPTIKVLFVYPLVAVLLKPSAVVLGAYIAMGYWNFVSHMNVRLSFGRFWFVLNSPQYHRIHHAADARYADCNFAALFPVYDLIFGTHRRPAKDEYPSTGLVPRETANGILDLIVWPVRHSLPVQRLSRLLLQAGRNTARLTRLIPGVY